MGLNKTVVIGVTGNTGSGKGEVCSILSERGAVIIDADIISHEILRQGKPAYSEVVSLFGKSILNGKKIDRRKIAAIVFTDSDMLKKHTEITHKYIREEILKRVGAYRQAGKRIIVIDAPLLIGSGLEGICDYIWLITADKKTKRKRIIKRDNISPDMARNRLLSQDEEEELLPFADCIIDNNGNLGKLRETVIIKLEELM